MRPVALLLVLVLALALAPPPTARAATWSVDALVAVTGPSTADYSWTLAGITNTRLKLPLPDNATFVEARDADGQTLAATVTGDQVEVTSGSKPFTLRFALQGRIDGPFSIFPAQVASASDSPVKVGITLPLGWTFAGYRDNDDGTPDASGVFRKVGPSYVEFLALAPGYVDQGPDARVHGESVRREASARIEDNGIQWTLTTTYDTDVFGRDWDVNVPEGATVVRAFTPVGELAPASTDAGIRVRTPYPVGFGLGGRSFTVEMRLPAGDVHGATFRLANLSVRAADGDTVVLTATLPPGARPTGSRVAGGEETAPLRYEARGPLSVGVAYLPPSAPGHIQFEEGLFVVDAPGSLHAAARATARNATELLPSAASFALDPLDRRPFYVAYTDADIFGWEEGFYSNGLNTITIRASTLADALDGAPHLEPVKVLIHEAAHGLVDRRLPDAPHNLSFLHEGLSRLAETLAEAAFPDQLVECRKTAQGEECERHSARPSIEDLRTRYAQGTSFDPAWGASKVPDSERGKLYDHSGLVLHTYRHHGPPGALENALLHVARTRFAGPDTADAQAFLNILLANAPGTTAEALLYPGASAAGLPAGEFQHCMGPLVAPPYPWEAKDVREPIGGCPQTGYGSRGAPLPAPPEQPVEPTPDPSPTRPPPPPRVSPPVTTTPTPPRDTADGRAPGAIEDRAPPPPPGSTPPPPIVIPASPTGLVVAALAAIALAWRKR